MLDILNVVQDSLVLGVSGSANGSMWSWSWTPDAQLQEICRKIAFFIGVLWVVYIMTKFMIPSRGRAGNDIKIWQVVVVLFIIIVLCDLTLLPKIINFVGEFVYRLADMFGWV